MQTDAGLHPTRKRRRIILSLVAALPLYILSTGPVAWATNDGLHAPYLPEELNLIYLPLMPLAKIPCLNQAFYWYTAEVWGGFPAGYTTL